MLPVLALTCSLSLSAWLLVCDVKRRPMVSSAVWLPTLLILALGSRSPSLWLALGTPIYGSGGDGSPLDHVFYLSLTIGSVIIASARRFKWQKLLTVNIGVTLFYLYFAVSILWAEDSSGSFKRWVKDLGYVGIVALLLSEKNVFEAVRAVYVRAASVLVPLSVVFCRYFPNIARRYTVEGGQELSGAAIDKNHLGEGVMVMTLFVLWDLLEVHAAGRKRRWRWDCLLLIGLAFWLMQLSSSKTAFACMVIGGVLMLRPKRLASSKMLNRILLYGAATLPVMVLLTQQFREFLAPILGLLGRDATFTGRTSIWEHITWNTVNPLIGAGFWNFWGGSRGIAITMEMRTIVPSAHNGYLDIYLDGGLIGIAVLALLLLQGGNRLIKSKLLQRHQLLRFAVLIAAIAYNLTESLFARPSVLWFTLLVVLIELPPGRRPVRKIGSRPARQSWPGQQEPLAEAETDRAQWLALTRQSAPPRDFGGHSGLQPL